MWPLKMPLWNAISILVGFTNFMVSSLIWKRLSNISMICEFEMWRRSLVKTLSGTVTVPSCYRNIFSFPFKRYLFCHILAMKTVAMENTQWSWHCERRQSSSSDNYVFSPERLQFSRRLYQQTGSGREKHVKRAHSNFNQQGRPWGWLTKWRKKNSFIVEETCQFTVTMTRVEKTGDVLGLCCMVNMLCTNLRVTRVWAGEPVQEAPHLWLHWIWFKMTSRPSLFIFPVMVRLKSGLI